MTTTISSTSDVIVRQLSVVALDDNSVTLSWQPHVSSHNADDADDGGDGDVMYELSFWRSDEFNRSTAIVMGQSENITVFGLRPDTRYCFTVTHLHTHRHEILCVGVCVCVLGCRRTCCILSTRYNRLSSQR